MPLERFYQAKRAEVAALRLAAERGSLPAPLATPRPDFAAALSAPARRAPLAVVAEYKRASPSRGVIRADLEAEEVVSQYAAAGAAALSILTEAAYFHGNLDYLRRAAAPGLYPAAPLPLLRKDFIFDSLQVRATAATPASALLLIVRLTPDVAVLRRLREEAESFGMSAVVEVFNAADLRLARESGARVIQVNARDLQTLAVNRAACLALAEAHPPENGEIWVAASGISAPAHLVQAASAGYGAALVGTALMEQARPGAALAALLGGKPAVGGA
ncbi:indole-3-glycerol phosphate synthase TrpC [Desulfovibrio sp. SGI.169]|uniref:indole-3-glycerol phosphate synthase TrpC n=1 Tax=Desulfovibrio sp. SGI.169 TaxID=3420561 RepID=UPI003D00D798